MERRARDFERSAERAADDRGDVVTRIAAEAAVTVTGTAVRLAAERRTAGRFAGHNVASRFASGGRNVANRFASGGDRFADRRKFAIRGASAAVISVITGLTERGRRA
jgi:hypothetical protein